MIYNPDAGGSKASSQGGQFSCNVGGEVSQVLAVWTLRLYFAGTNTEIRSIC